METVSPKAENITYIHQDVQWPIITLEENAVAAEEISKPYPIDALPSVIQDAVSAYHKYGQQPLPLIACSALANVSLACQSHSNVARDKYLVSPISLYFIGIAESGARKTCADSTFSKAVKEWQIAARKKLEPEIKVASLVHEAWTAEKEGLLAQIRRSSLTGEDATYLQYALKRLVENEPVVPLLPVLFFEDATSEALASHIATGWASTSLWSDEGGIVIGGHGMQSNATKFIALLNRLWDGNPFTAHRKTSNSFTIANRRLTLSLMMQPIILEQMLFKSDGISRQSGFLARSLIAYPDSGMGKRFYQEPPTELASLPEFHARITECLDDTLDLDKNGCHSLPTLMLSKKAKSEWILFFNKIESGLVNKWVDIKDFASKSAENVVRLAALFHIFEGKSGDISAENIDRAIQVINWHLGESRRILGETSPARKQPKQSDARILFRFILEKELSETSPRQLQQLGPIREKNRRDAALAILLNEGYLMETKRDNKTVLLVNPCFL